MSTRVCKLLNELRPDDWRARAGFSPEVEAVNRKVFRPGATETEIVSALNGWIEKHQPCLFGRIAARRGLIRYCVLTDLDLQRADEAISGKIEEAHTLWGREGAEGRTSAFIVTAVSQRIALAEPGPELLELARILVSFLLRTEVLPDRIYLDEILLELPTSGKATWRWDVGVNYFGAQGDGRWWNDHRMPGGLAFSTNSVGHMVKSGKLALAERQVEEIMGLPKRDLVNTRIDSLEKALELAMRTIHNASDTTSGRATELLPMPEDTSELPLASCPIDLPRDLANKNFCEYLGRYHTDYTLPSEYFSPDVERPPTLNPHLLDFTYLFDDSIFNPDFLRVGQGRRIRTGNKNFEETIDRFTKRGKGVGSRIS